MDVLLGLFLYYIYLHDRKKTPFVVGTTIFVLLVVTILWFTIIMVMGIVDVYRNCSTVTTKEIDR